jgi:hypothetical protein
MPIIYISSVCVCVCVRECVCMAPKIVAHCIQLEPSFKIFGSNCEKKGEHQTRKKMRSASCRKKKNSN